MNKTRREFLARTLGSTAVVSFGSVYPHFWLRAASGADPSNGETVLVVVQLSGGNDGLNTVVPFGDPEYRRKRPTLAIAADEVLTVTDEIGFHPSLRGFADLLEDNRLAVVQGVGYPNPNRSHFESMDIWHTCQRKTERRVDGWLGRYLDLARSQLAGDVAAMHLGSEKQPFALAARHVRVPSVRSLEGFRLQVDGDEELSKSIEQLTGGPRRGEHDLLDFVRTSTVSALAASRRVAEASRDYTSNQTYPDTELGRNLRSVAQLVDAGLSTRIYYVALDGFDTHARQIDAHAALLRQFSEAVTAFLGDVKDHGHGDRVLVMAFSEFGRRVRENASEGTDHGTAAPMFLAGSPVNAGLIGAHPSLADLEDGDLKYHTDFRQVYACVLEKWLGWESANVLGGQYEAVEAIG